MKILYNKTKVAIYHTYEGECDFNSFGFLKLKDALADLINSTTRNSVENSIVDPIDETYLRYHFSLNRRVTDELRGDYED